MHNTSVFRVVFSQCVQHSLHGGHERSEHGRRCAVIHTVSEPGGTQHPGVSGRIERILYVLLYHLMLKLKIMNNGYVIVYFTFVGISVRANHHHRLEKMPEGKIMNKIMHDLIKLLIV